MTVLEMKVEALMKCVPQDVLEKAMAEVFATETPATVRDVSHDIRTHLTVLGTPAHIKGYRYMVYAIEQAATNPDLIDAITSELYPIVAKEYDTTPSRVERAIRHAVEVTWDRGDIETLIKYFGNTVSNTKGKPTNSEFIARMAIIIRDQVK